MAKNLGTFEFAANFKVKAAEALDPRMVAASKADLINKANWPADGNTIYVYKGLIVDCGEDGVYRLINPANALSPDYSGWLRIDAGGVLIDNIFTYKGSVPSYSSLPSEGANVGDVYNIEEDFSIIANTPLDDEIVKNYAAGTNVAWNGSEWDPLTGAIDLSAYASKLEVSEIRVDVKSNTEAINELTLQLESANLELSNKVDMVEGSSLITNEKLLLIDSNTNRIITLLETAESLGSRLLIAESTINNDLKLKVENHENAIITLVNDNSENKQQINNLLSISNSQENRLTIVELTNEQLSKDITNVTLQLIQLDNTVTNLTETVDNHTQELSLIKNSIKEYIGGDGLLVVDNKIEIILDPSESNRLTITENGLMVSMEEDIAEIGDVIDDKINESFKWDTI